MAPVQRNFSAVLHQSWNNNIEHRGAKQRNKIIQEINFNATKQFTN
jgi:hypothetical protein